MRGERGDVKLKEIKFFTKKCLRRKKKFHFWPQNQNWRNYRSQNRTSNFLGNREGRERD